MAKRYRHLQIAWRTLITGVALLLLVSQVDHVGANNHLTRIEEVLAGANGNSKIQFIVIQQQDSAQNQWGPTNCLQSAAMLVFFDATGRETGKFQFPENPPTEGTFKVLMATPEFANLPGAPRPDLILPPLLNPISGKVCFKSNFANIFTFGVNLCLSYGNFTGDTEEAGPPAPALPILNTVSLRRTPGTGFFGGNVNSDFQLTTTPTPTNIAGATFTMPVATQVDQGANLFNSEPFLGNGRTCGSCHAANLSFRITPGDVQSRFATLADSFDPLFIAETLPSSFDPGFDFNLNTLVLTAPVASNAPCTGELRGLITSAGGGRGKVLTRVSETTYLIYGGVNPPLAGTVSDGVCSASVSSVTAGDLNTLEDPKRMRTSASLDFPEGRALILENIDGFENPPVFRKSPPLLNLSRTAPFGFSGNVPDLQVFATGAVIQHFPRTLARNAVGPSQPNPDFRLPTSDELAAIEAFLLAQEFPPGNAPNKFDLTRFVVTAAQQSGRDLFFGDVGKCSRCHGGEVLAQTTVQILNQPPGVNGSFNTGVVNQLINSAVGDDLPCEPSTPSVGSCGSREFSVPQLFNVKNLGPFFHDASAATLLQAVDFYNSAAFNTSPAGVAIGGIALNVTQVSDIVAFLEGLTVSAGPSTPQATARSLLALEDTPLALTLTGSDPDGDSLTFAIATGPSNGSLSAITSLTATSAQVTYTPNGNFNGSDSFSFTAADGVRTSTPATISISVRPANDPPTANSQSLTTPEDTPLTIAVSGSDPDQDALIFFDMTSPAHGFLSGTFSNLITYTPFQDFNGTDGFSFRVRDRDFGLGIGDGICSDTATVSLTVSSVNDPPGAVGQSATIPEETPITLTLTASDSDGDSLTFAIATGPSNGSLSAITPLTPTSAQVTYTPNLNFGGLDSFTFRVSDPSGLTSDATIALRIGFPTATSQSVSTPEDTALSVTLTGSDPDGDSLTFAIAAGPSSGSLSAITPLTATSARLTYTPNGNFNGSDSFSFRVTDTRGLSSDLATVFIFVSFVNDPPVANAGPDQTVTGRSPTTSSVLLDGSASSDPDNSFLTFRWTGPFPEGGGTLVTFDSRPTVSLPLGVSNLTLVVNDSQVDSPPDTVSITVTDFAVAASPASATVSRGQAATYTVTVSPQFGPFGNGVSIACLLPATLTQVSCSLSPPSVTPGANPVNSTMTLSTTAPSASLLPPFGPESSRPFYAFWLGLPGLALAGLTVARGRTKKTLQVYAALALLAAILLVEAACGGGGSSRPPPNPGTPVGTHTITVNATSNALVRSTSVTLVVQ